MKKISNNGSLGKLTVLFNLLIFVLFIISMIFLMKFDKVNIKYVTTKPAYEKALDELRTAQQPTRLDSASVAHYQYRVDTLNAHFATVKGQDAKKVQDEIKRVSTILQEKQEIKHTHDSVVLVKKAVFEPIETNFKEIEENASSARGTFMIMFTLCLVVFLVKIVFFALWNYKNSNNLSASTKWAKKGSAPYWAFVGWIIPVYNLIKPYAFFQETATDTEYLLKSKGIMSEGEDKNDDNSFYIGLWWGFFLLAVCLCVLFLFGTFFRTGPLFVKLSHFNVMMVSIIVWLCYLLLESFVIFRFNKMNKMLFDNQDKL